MGGGPGHAGGLPEPLPYPERLGRWPAALALFAFVWMELVAESGNTPSSLAIATLIYSAVNFLGMALYGVNAWIDRAEGFSVYFNLISRISPLERRGRELGVRRPLSGLAALDPLPGTVAVLMVMIGSVSFDGFSGTETWSSIVPTLQDFWDTLGLGPGTTLELSFATGLVVSILHRDRLLHARDRRRAERGRGPLGRRTCGGPSSIRSCRSRWCTRRLTT